MIAEQVSLNLRLPKDRVEMAKEMAREMGTSVSALVADFILAMARMKQEPVSLPPALERLSGAIPPSDVSSDEDLILDALEEKYGTSRDE